MREYSHPFTDKALKFSPNTVRAIAVTIALSYGPGGWEDILKEIDYPET